MNFIRNQTCFWQCSVLFTDLWSVYRQRVNSYRLTNITQYQLKMIWKFGDHKDFNTCKIWNMNKIHNFQPILEWYLSAKLKLIPSSFWWIFGAGWLDLILLHWWDADRPNWVRTWCQAQLVSTVSHSMTRPNTRWFWLVNVNTVLSYWTTDNWFLTNQRRPTELNYFIG